MVAYDLGLPGLDSVEYFVTNVDHNTAVTTFPGLPAAHFEDPVHHYDAVEITADKRLSNNWSLQSSYRWSRLWGNFEGFYRDDNGQSDPGWTSLYDFPTNDPSYTAIGVPQFGYEASGIRQVRSQYRPPLSRRLVTIRGFRPEYWPAFNLDRETR
jgi:hypothetical protein